MRCVRRSLVFILSFVFLLGWCLHPYAVYAELAMRVEPSVSDIQSFGPGHKIMEGRYTISNVASDGTRLFLAAPAAVADDVGLQAMAESESAAQQWDIAPVVDEVTGTSSGFVTVSNAESGLCIEASRESDMAFPVLRLSYADGSVSQQWALVQLDDGAALVSAADSSVALALVRAESSSTEAGASGETPSTGASAADLAVTDGSVTDPAAADASVPDHAATDATSVDLAATGDSAAGTVTTGDSASGPASVDDSSAEPATTDGSEAGSGYRVALVDVGERDERADIFWTMALLDATGDAGEGPSQPDHGGGDGSHGGGSPSITADIDALARERAGELADGTYLISSSLRMRSVLDVAQGSATDGANVRLYENAMADAQQWMVCAQSDGSGFVRIVNLRSGKVLDVSGGRAESGANVQQYRWNGTRAQLWLPLRQEDGSLVLYSALGNDLVLDVSGGSVANGANIGLWKANGTGAQRFYATSCDVSVASGGRVLPDGVYTLSPCLDPSLKLDLYDASTANGAPLQLHAANGGDAQAFRITYGEDGFYDLRVISSAKALEIAHGDVLAGSPVTQRAYNAGSQDQRWRIDLLDDGSYRFTSKSGGLVLDAGAALAGTRITGRGECATASQAWIVKAFAPSFAEGCYTLTSATGARVLDVANASVAEGAAMQLYRSHGALAQKWWVRTLADGSITLQSVCSGKYLALDASGRAVQIADHGSSRACWRVESTFNGPALINCATGQALDVSGASDADGAKVQGYAPNGTNAQGWRFSPTRLMTDGFYTITSVADTRYKLDVADASMQNYANVQLCQGNGSLAQTWWVRSTANGYYTFTAGCSAKDLEIADGSAASGANVRQLTRMGSGAQCWTFHMGEHGVVARSYLGTVLDGSGSPGNAVNVVANAEDPSAATQQWLLHPVSVPSKIGYQNPSQFFQVSQYNVILPRAAYQTPFCYVTPSRIAIDATREQCVEAFIARAYEYLGSPYVWNYSLAPGVGVDCSGLVMQCAYATGMNLDTYNPYHHWYDPWHSHDANNMAADPRFMHVRFADRRRGDLIFSPGHVSIYLGDDKIIEAYSPKEGVRIASVYSSLPVTGVARPFV